jgi:hypothetical protein
MIAAPEQKLVVKHTFLEFVHEQASPVTRPLRPRSRTEGDECPAHQDDSTSCGSSDSVDDPEQVEALSHATFMPATPEFSPLRCPMYSSQPSSSQDELWGESLPAAAMSAEQIAMWQYAAAAGQFWQGFPQDLSAGYALPADYYNSFVENQSAAMCSAGSDRAHRHARPALPTIAEKEVPAVVADGKETRTTVMMKGLPDTYTRSDLLKLLDNEGFFGRFNFIYVPIDFKRQRNLGYALINLVSPKEAIRFSNRFEGFCNWSCLCDTVCEVAWCNPHQGLPAHVERYRNSPVMHESVPEEWRPLLLSHGVSIPFPAPTTKIKCPKLKGKQ